MISNKAILQSLPLLASVLGKTYGVRVEVGGNQAFTNGKVIQLPSLPSEADPDFIGLVRGYLDHEAAHIRDTDFSILEGLTALEKNIWNTLEDLRVEKKLSELFPGCTQNFNWLARHIFLKVSDDDLVKDAGVLILNWLLFKVRSWEVKELVPKCNMLEFSLDANCWGLKFKIEEVLGRMKDNCPDSAACLEYAREIIGILQKEAESKTSQESHEDSGNKSEPDSKESASEKPEQNDGSYDDTHTNETASDSLSETGCNRTDDREKPEDELIDQSGNPESFNCSREQNADEDSDDNTAKAIERLISASESELPEDLGKILSKIIETRIEKDSSTHIEVARLGTKTLWELYPDTISALRLVTTGMRARFHALLQSKRLNQKHLSRKGRLDTGKLYRTAIDNPKVFTKQSEKQGINTAVHILLDCSSSMIHRIKLASQVCHSVAKALEMVGVTTGVTAFPGNNDHTCPQFYTVAPIVRHGQKIHNRFLINESGSTPMGEALWWVMREMLPLKENRKLILIITDGDPDSRENTMEAIKAGRQMNMEIYGIGIESHYINDLLPENSVNITSLNDLAQSMFKLLGKALNV